jgi:hypothetical protein
MASDERAPRSSGSGGRRRDSSPHKGGSSGKNAPRSSGGPRKDGAPGKSGSSYSGGARSSSPRDGKPRDGAPRSGNSRSGATSNSGPRSVGTRSAGYREERAPRVDRPVKKGPPAPEIPDEITIGQLDRSVRSRLRTLSKENAEDVGRHLIMAGNLLDSDPELAYQHAAVAAARGGRVDVVREAAAVTAYATGRYAEALREFRTVRRLNGSSEHLALMADCERGLGRPERAIALANEPEAKSISPAAKIELAIVVAGARSDMGDKEAALVALKRLNTTDPELQSRIDEATAAVLRDLGRIDEADAIEPSIPVEEPEDEDVIVYDTFEDEEAPTPSTAEEQK